MNPYGQIGEDDEQDGVSLPLLVAGLVAPAALLVLAAIVLLGLSLPGRSSGQPGKRALPAIVVAAETPLPVQTALPPSATPFVLRPPAALIDRSGTPAPGSQAAAIAAMPACVALSTGRAPNGYRLGDGVLDIIAHNHPECP